MIEPLHVPTDTEPDHDRDVPEDDASADDGSEVVPNFGDVGYANTDEFRDEEG